MLAVDGHIDIFNDDSGNLKTQVPIVLDGDINTCFDLPVQGDTPPLFWVRMNTSVIFGINPAQFDIVVSGEGISCAKHSSKRVLQVKKNPTIFYCFLLHVRLISFKIRMSRYILSF